MERSIVRAASKSVGNHWPTKVAWVGLELVVAKTIWPAVLTRRIYRTDIWMQADRSILTKACATGGPIGPAFAGTTMKLILLGTRISSANPRRKTHQHGPSSLLLDGSGREPAMERTMREYLSRQCEQPKYCAMRFLGASRSGACARRVERSRRRRSGSPGSRRRARRRLEREERPVVRGDLDERTLSCQQKNRSDCERGSACCLQ